MLRPVSTGLYHHVPKPCKKAYIFPMLEMRNRDAERKIHVS